jgi:S-adenosylmethionine uptake transporter
MHRPADPTNARTLRTAVLLTAFGEAVLTLMDAIIKSTTARYPILEVTFLRFAAGSLFALLLLAVMRPGRPTREAVLANSARALLVVVTATSFFFALARLPLADAIALAFIAPVLMALFGMLLLGERVDRRILAALAAGFAGMIVIVAGEAGRGSYSSDAWLGAAACLVSAVSYALVVVLLRVRAQRDAVPVILLFQTAAPALMLALPAALVWVPPEPRDLALFGLVGAIGIAGHFALAEAFARVEAARLAPVHYTTLAWGVLLGWLAFGDVPGLTTLLGAGMIVAATLLAQRR